MPQRVEIGPGTYPVRNTATGVATNYIVPTLTVAIAQASLTVGQTASLTTNAAPGAAYQWTLDGANISGATSATYPTAAAGTLRCRVTSGAQVVTSDPVTVAAGGSAFDAAYVARASVESEDFVASHTFSGLSIGAAASDRVVFPMFHFRRSSPLTSIQMSVNGGAPVDPLLFPTNTEFLSLFRAPIAAGTTANFTFTAVGGGQFRQARVGIIRAVGPHTYAFAEQSGGTSGDWTLGLNTLAGDRMFAGACAVDANPFTQPVGWTEHFDDVISPASGFPFISMMSSGIAAGGSPENFTFSNNDNRRTGILLRIREGS